MDDNKKWERWPNQYRMLENPDDLTEGAEALLQLIKKYGYIYNVTNTQYAHLLGISLRNTVKYVNELIDKNKIEVYPESRKKGRGRANSYRVIDENSSQ